MNRYPTPIHIKDFNLLLIRPRVRRNNKRVFNIDAIFRHIELDTIRFENQQRKDKQKG